MHIITKILIGVVILFHSYVMVFEMFMWESRGPNVFTAFPKDLFAPTKVMAANQGLYNGFLAAGLIWALVFIKDPIWKKNVALFFLACVIVAGIYGSMTAARGIFFVQALPAIIAALSLLFLTRKLSQ